MRLLKNLKLEFFAAGDFILTLSRFWMTISPSYGLAHKPQMIFLATKAVAFLMLNLVGHLLALALQ